MHLGDFPGSLVVKTPPSNAEGASLIPGWRAKIPHASWPQNQNINNKSNIITNSIKTLKVIHVRKKIFKKRKKVIKGSNLSFEGFFFCNSFIDL